MSKKKNKQKQEQDQKMKQKMKQQQQQNDTISNIGNPTINVNVTTASSDVDVDQLVRASAFRAVKTVNQVLVPNTPVQVLYQDEQFDLANEYNPTTSTFSPTANGVYSVIGTVSFSPNFPNLPYRTRIEIRVNGNPAIAIDNDFFSATIPSFSNVVEVSSILQLQAGDQVTIFAESNIGGTIALNTAGGNSTHFEAARFPSPTV